MLLTAARVSANASCGDGLCVHLIDQCIAHLSEQYDLPSVEPDEGEMWTEGSLAALVRLVIYVHAEVSEILHDRRAENLLKQCIDHLLQIHLPYSQQPDEGALRLTH